MGGGGFNFHYFHRGWENQPKSGSGFIGPHEIRIPSLKGGDEFPSFWGPWPWKTGANWLLVLGFMGTMNHHAL